MTRTDSLLKTSHWAADRTMPLLETTIGDVLRAAAERVAPYKRVRRYEFVESIPRTPSGKIIRRTLIDRERRAAGVAVS